jgi:putative ATP-dependent endonuclease of the OLD family
MKTPDSARPHLLLIDEPEICLHPAAIRDACKALYGLPTSTGKWQVMLTTHSPIFIDFSKDNTTIVRVEKELDGGIKGTTIFRPDKAQLSSDDQQNLKLLNICDPYVAEFFFGGRIVIVEGDTEYTAFSYVRSQNPDEYRDVHIIRARGKATIVSLVKVLNHFGANYSILHDSDKQKTENGDKANPAWANNSRILDAVKAKLKGTQARLLASVPNFEEAYLGYIATDEKPYKALQKIMADPGKQATIKDLLDDLLDRSKTPPTNCVEWFHIEELAKLSETQ